MNTVSSESHACICKKISSVWIVRMNVLSSLIYDNCLLDIFINVELFFFGWFYWLDRYNKIVIKIIGIDELKSQSNNLNYGEWGRKLKRTEKNTVHDILLLDAFNLNKWSDWFLLKTHTRDSIWLRRSWCYPAGNKWIGFSLGYSIPFHSNSRMSAHTVMVEVLRMIQLCFFFS